MNRGVKALTVVTVIMLGLWGCAKRPAAPGAGSDRVRALESRCAKLEQDYRAVAEARDQAQKQAAGLEEENARLQKEAGARAALARERDDLRRQLARRTAERDEQQEQSAARANERDALQVRCDRLRKGLQDLLGQDEGRPPIPSSGAPDGPDVGGAS